MDFAENILFGRYKCMVLPYPPKNKPPPLSVVDMAQTREGAYLNMHNVPQSNISPPLA